MIYVCHQYLDYVPHALLVLVLTREVEARVLRRVLVESHLRVTEGNDVDCQDRWVGVGQSRERRQQLLDHKRLTVRT